MENGRLLKMIHLKTMDPYSDLKQNFYVFPELFDTVHDFQLELVSENSVEKALLFRRKYNGSTAGFAYVVCKDTELDLGAFRMIFGHYSRVVREYGKRDFKEVDLYVVCKNAT